MSSSLRGGRLSAWAGMVHQGALLSLLGALIAVLPVAEAAVEWRCTPYNATRFQLHETRHGTR